MTQMLRHKSTGDLYVFTDLLYKRGDMEIVEQEVTEEVEATAETSKKTTRKSKTPVQASELDFDV